MLTTSLGYQSVKITPLHITGFEGGALNNTCCAVSGVVTLFDAQIPNTRNKEMKDVMNDIFKLLSARIGEGGSK